MNKYHLNNDQLDAWNAVKRFAKDRIAPHAQEIDASDKFPAEIFRELAEHGYMGAAQPVEYAISADLSEQLYHR